jgi:RNA polymerase-binding protein DksA
MAPKTAHKTAPVKKTPANISPHSGKNKLAAKVVKKPAAKKPPTKPLALRTGNTAEPTHKKVAKPSQKKASAQLPATKTVARGKLSPAPSPQTKLPLRPAVPAQAKSDTFHHQPPVATNLKPRKSQIGLSVKELEHFTDLLRAKRRELVGDMGSMEREALRSGSASNLSTLPIHMADMGTDNYEQEFTLSLVEKDRNLLREINNALAKIQNGTYGICEGTALPISKARLEAQPWARYSIEYARQREKNGMGVRTL